MSRILVSGSSGIVGYGILRTLRQARARCLLVGTSIYGDSVAPAFCDVFELAPHTGAAEYLDWLLTTLRRHRIDMLIPGIEIDMYHWVEHIPEIRRTGALPLLNDPGLIDLCKDKWFFYQRVAAAGISCVIESSLERDFFALRARFGLPFLLKPRRGFGSRGIIQVDSEAVFNRHCANVGPVLMAQPMVGTPAEEFTISAFGNGCGSYLASMALRRRLSNDGFTDKAEVVDTAEFSAAMGELCGLLNPVGPTNFQFRRTVDGLKLLEINPRISSSTSIRAAFGYNEAAMALDYFLDQREPAQPVIHRGHAVRFIDEKLFFESDTSGPCD